MKVLMVVSNYFPMICGYSVRVHEIASNIAKTGWDVTILAPKRNNDAPNEQVICENLRVIRYPFHGYLSSLSLLKRIRLLVKKEGFDIVLGHSPEKCVIAAILGCWGLDKPVVFMMHYLSTTMESNKNPIKYGYWHILDKFIYHQVKKISVISQAIKKNLLVEGVDEEKIIYLPNGVDTEKFKPMPRNKNLENRLGLEGKKVILFLGKFQRWENLDKLVEIFAKIKKNRDSTILLLVGDGPEREKIERKIKALGLEGYIKITGFISFDETPEYYNLCDVFVIVREDSPLTDTTTPIKPLEVMACGKVVVSTDVGGLREVIEDGKTGFLVKSQEGVLVMIISLLDDQKKLNKIGSEAREYVQQEREWGVIIKSFSESLTELKK